jgi:molybdopterin converting factor subunit 1
MSTVVVRFFAAARERAGCSEERVETPAGTQVRELLEQLCVRHPALTALLPHLRVAVNHEFVGVDARVPEAAEVALIPPVAGGSGEGSFRVLDRPLSLDAVVERVSGSGQGGVVTFSGAVRNSTRGRAVLRLEYEAYAVMAERKLAAIGAELSTQWPGVRVAIHHRVGVLAPGELAVVIAASAPHRGEAFCACREAIERLKAEVPIWKKEVYEDGEVWVGLGP